MLPSRGTEAAPGSQSSRGLDRRRRRRAHTHTLTLALTITPHARTHTNPNKLTLTLTPQARAHTHTQTLTQKYKTQQLTHTRARTHTHTHTSNRWRRRARRCRRRSKPASSPPGPPPVRTVFYVSPYSGLGSLRPVCQHSPDKTPCLVPCWYLSDTRLRRYNRATRGALVRARAARLSIGDGCPRAADAPRGSL